MLKDCSPIDIDKFATTYFGRGKNAGDRAQSWLAKLAKIGIEDSQLFKLSGKNFEDEPIVYCDRFGKWWTGRFIGSLHFEGVSIEIHPRFGLEFVADNIPLNNFIPVKTNASFFSGDKFIHFLQAMLWLNLLGKAAKHTLPAVKVDRIHTSSISRGRIDIRRTIKTRLKDQSKITSISSYKETSNPITTTVVLAFLEIQRWFPEHNLLNWLPETIVLRVQQMIDATPRHSAIPKARDIKNARLGSMAKAYIPLTRLSLDILKNKGVSEKVDDNENSTLLVDVAELWEIYILDILREALTSVEVIHGTDKGDKFLLTDKTGKYQLGKLLPDYIFNINGNTTSIGDAKYKRLGDAPWMSPKRDDLYQMTAYLSRYSDCGSGCFYYPDWGDTCSITENNPWLLESGHQSINFITVPTNKSDAVSHLRKLYNDAIYCKDTETRINLST